MRRVKQRDDEGCGISCVASILDLSYAQAQTLLLTVDESNDPTEGTYGRHLKAALAKGRVKCAPRFIPLRSKRIHDLPFSAVIKTNLRRNGRDWHWVIWDCDRGVIIDSKDPPYKKLRPVSYLKFERADQLLDETETKACPKTPS